METKEQRIDKWDRLDKSWEYQDWLAMKLASLGIILIALQSTKYQNIGENLGGFEIKNDNNFEETGNLYFETHGRWYKDWTERGLLKKDNSWLWIIGNYHKAYIVSKEQILKLYEKPALYQQRGIRIVVNDNARSKGIVIPIKFLKEHQLILRELNFS